MGLLILIVMMAAGNGNGGVSTTTTRIEFKNMKACEVAKKEIESDFESNSRYGSKLVATCVRDF